MTGDTICVFAAHPDDEILGCGASMAKHASNGDSVHVVITAEGVTSRSRSREDVIDNESIRSLVQASKDANDCLGVKSISFLSLPDNRLDSLDLLDVVKKIEEKKNSFHPIMRSL